MTVTGIDLNRNGIPNGLQQPQVSNAAPMEYGRLVNYAHALQKALTVAGMNMHRDGVPVVSQPPANHVVLVQRGAPIQNGAPVHNAALAPMMTVTGEVMTAVQMPRNRFRLAMERLCSTVLQCPWKSATEKIRTKH